MKEDPDTLQHDPITAPPESSDNEAENIPMGQASLKDNPDSDEEYDRRRTADIRTTNFDRTGPSKASSFRANNGKIRPPSAYKKKAHIYKVDEPSSLAGSKRSAGESGPKEIKELERDAETPGEKKKKKQPRLTYGSQQKSTRLNELPPRSSASKSGPTSSASQDGEQSISVKNSFQRPKSISPTKLKSPRKPVFRRGGQSFDLNEADSPGPSFKDIPLHGSSPSSTPGRRSLRHTSPTDQPKENKNAKSTGSVAKGPRKGARVNRKSAKGRKPSPDHIEEELSQRPVFKMPELEDLYSFDDSGSQDATTVPGESPDNTWDHLEIRESEHTSTPRCPMCHQEVDREFLEKHSTCGKMSVKKQTTFCRLHKQESALKLAAERGYPKIDWEKMESRCSAHLDLLQKILEGTLPSHYRKVLKEKVDSGKNRTLLTNKDNLTPGYYGPRGLLVMTEFIIRTLSPVIRKRAVEDRLISARSYTGYVQAVLVPELTVRLIMEDMSVTEERARDILVESVEVGELLHEETRDVVRIAEEEEEEGDEDEELL
ncbi:hypothetical protein HD806DRAFT_535213 [Xylariaceae sp. AK1471]|nr:hypothetical protein HD806DRAFT_535213 [Xylariaceae sp. AK1471]